MSIKHPTPADLPELQQMFANTISTICKDDYTPEQIEAWISSREDTQRWAEKIASQYFLIAELDQKIVGFSSLAGADYLDFLYVHKDYQRRGIAEQLYDAIEKEAIKRKGTVLYSNVSKTAQPFFKKKGFKTLTAQTNVIRGVEIVNFRMVKGLI